MIGAIIIVARIWIGYMTTDESESKDGARRSTEIAWKDGNRETMDEILIEPLVYHDPGRQVHTIGPNTPSHQ